MARMVTNLRILILAGIGLVLPGCGSMYVAQAAKGQLQILNERRPIDRVIADPRSDPELRRRLTTVREAREFASAELGLPNNRSYRSYADLGREFVVWSVVATPEFSVEPREWCFPIVGCVEYRGYFREASAEKFAARLREEGFDTIIGGVPAYSTLGKFNDPIMNTMMTYGDDELASILFHELSHQLVYIPDDSSFNEAFAVAVEREGLTRWLRKHGRESDLGKYLKRRERQAAGIGLVRRYREELAALYRLPLPEPEMRARKTAVFARLREEVRDLDSRHGIQSRLAEELNGPPNNARLASFATYYECVPGFERLLEQQDHDLERFYAAARELAKLPRAERRARLCTSGATSKS
jgi:predicted aminopeptidase